MTGSQGEITAPLHSYHSSKIPSYLYQKQESLLNMVLFGTIKYHILIWKSSVSFGTPEASVSSPCHISSSQHSGWYALESVPVTNTEISTD